MLLCLTTALARVLWAFIFPLYPLIGLGMYISRRHTGRGVWILKSGVWILKSGVWILESGVWILKSRVWILECGSGF